MPARKRKPLTDAQRQLKRERDRRYRARQKERLALVDMTPYQARKARETRAATYGPLPREKANVYGDIRRAAAGMSLHEADRQNRAWVDSQHAMKVRLSQYSAFDFNVHSVDAESRRGLAIFANQYHPDYAAKDDAYVYAFYNAIVNPESNYYATHESNADHTSYSPRMVGAKVYGEERFRDYLVKFSQVVARVDPDEMGRWFDERYTMALAGNI